ncbi:LacI family DNA-binding transcriptional regulator [Ravibacter arvi]
MLRQGKNRKRPTTIKDIAKALNISVSTVSRAIRDTYDVGQETRSKVLEMAAQLKYRPNLNATGLVKSSTKKIGVVIPAITNYYFSTVITGMKDVARENDFQLVLYISDDSSSSEADILRNLSVHSVDGLLICLSSETTDYELFAELMEDGLPIVFFDRVPSEINTSKVVQDDFNGAYRATTHLVRQGYRRLAHITGPSGLQLTEDRLAGFVAALRDAQIQLNPDWVIHSGFSRQHGFEDTLLLSAMSERPDAIFAVNDPKAIGAMLACRTNDIVVGAEMGVIGFTNDPVAEIVTPTLSSVAEPAYEIGRKSCELLLKHIKKENFPGETAVLSGELFVRDSTKK